MRYLLILIVFLGVVCTGNAQTIDSIVIFPSNPTTDDSIKFYCFVTYGASDCELTNQWIELEDNSVYIGNAIHCMNNALTLCPTIDTFTIPPLAIGNYQFKYFPGFDPVCNVPETSNGDPVPFPWRRDSIDFSVVLATSATILSIEINLKLFPNPATRKLTIQLKNELIQHVQIFNDAGELAKSFNLRASTCELNISQLPPGVYFIQINGNYVERFIVIS